MLVLVLLLLTESVVCLSSSSKTRTSTSTSTATSSTTGQTYSFQVPLTNARPKPESILDTFVELWNDPRPIGSVIASSDRSFVSSGPNDAKIPYCIISDEFQIDTESFQILLYPRGRFIGDTNVNNNNDQEVNITGPASAYLRYLPKSYGDEVDIAWKLTLKATSANDISISLPVITSGGLPKSNDTWSAAMTFCSEMEAVESVGRATDWGSSCWLANDVCKVLTEPSTSPLSSTPSSSSSLFAKGEITVFQKRSGESSFAWPPASKGGIGSVINSSLESTSAVGDNGKIRNFRAGEVIVPTKTNKSLKKSFIYPGIDYRIMTMTDKDGNPIFSTESIKDEKERSQARLALRPCGWKVQQQVWRKNGMINEWPVEIEAGQLSSNGAILTRFNYGSALPRIVSAFKRDFVAYSVALLVALTPIPLALLARNAVSFYAIPSASMDPTLLKGDVLLVEKLPGVLNRIERSDVILFKPPPALRDIITGSGSQISGSSLFVKRIVGLPGDRNIRITEDNDVMINGEMSRGPDRSLCPDEPLRLIDRLLENGKGKKIDELGKDDVYVLGDCKAVSVDSRVFGVLPKANVVGRPIARIWPLNRFQSSGKF